jgi:serine/threonine protein kinase
MNEPDTYWMRILKRRPSDYFSDDFKDLVFQMFNPDPEFRLSIEEIMNHNWMKEDSADKDDIQLLFEMYMNKQREKAKVNHEHFSDKIEKKKAKERAVASAVPSKSQAFNKLVFKTRKVYRDIQDDGKRNG